MTTVLKPLVFDDYVMSVLMRDLVSHDRTPSAFLVYLHLWAETKREATTTIRTSHQTMSEKIGLSKSAVQKGVQALLRRKLISVHKDSVTATPEYRVLRPWKR